MEKDNLRALLLGRPLRSDARYKPFFIVGSGRCGTTLLRAILDVSPSVHIPPETYVLDGAARDFQTFSRLPWTTLLRLVLSRLEYQKHFHTFGISLRPLYQELVETPRENRNLAYVLNRFYLYHAAAVKPSAVRWGDKTPTAVFQLRHIRRVFPDAVVIHMLRDGRDVVRSFLDAGFAKRSVERAADRWTRAVRAARQFGERYPDQFIEVRYEELVTAPEAQVRQVCAKLDIEFLDGMMQHHEIRRDLGDVSHFAFHANVQTPITASRVGSWKERLSESEAELATRLLRNDLQTLGYPV